MGRKVFYTIVQKGGVIGARKVDGYDVKIDGMKVNARIGEDGQVFFIDPKTGLAFYSYDYDEYGKPVASALEKIKEAKQREYEKLREAVEGLRKLEGRESYGYAQKMYAAYSQAEYYRERQQEAIRREKREAEKREKAGHDY